MNRRDSVAAVMAMGMAPHLAHAQSAGKVFLVGFLAGVTSAAARTGPVAAGMVDGLRALGYSEGRHFHIEARFAEGQIERLPELAAELVLINVDVIVASTNLAAFPAKQATSTIPIVVIASHGADETGLVTAWRAQAATSPASRAWRQSWTRSGSNCCARPCLRRRLWR